MISFRKNNINRRVIKFENGIARHWHCYSADLPDVTPPSEILTWLKGSDERNIGEMSVTSAIILCILFAKVSVDMQSRFEGMKVASL